MELWEFEALAWVVIWILPILLGGVIGAVIAQSKGFAPYEGAAVVIGLDLLMRGVGWLVQEVGAPVAGFAVFICGALLGIFILSLMPRRPAGPQTAEAARAASSSINHRQQTGVDHQTDDEHTHAQQRWRQARIARLRSPSKAHAEHLQRERLRVQMLREGRSPTEVFLNAVPETEGTAPQPTPPVRGDNPVKHMLDTPSKDRRVEAPDPAQGAILREAELHRLELESELYDVRQQRLDAEEELERFQTLKDLIDERVRLSQVQSELDQLRKEYDAFTSSQSTTGSTPSASRQDANHE